MSFNKGLGKFLLNSEVFLALAINKINADLYRPLK
jgi:hypothetical protein